jgi:hypothetical protein
VPERAVERENVWRLDFVAIELSGIEGPTRMEILTGYSAITRKLCG